MGTHDQDVSPFDAVILAGGSAQRFGGTDKVLLAVGGQPMLERVLAAVGAARTIVVVGPERSLAGSSGRTIRWTREHPAGSGPLAALAAGLTFGSAPVVVVLAGDMPMVDATTVTTLVAASAGGSATADVDGAVLVDGEGHRQPLAAAYRRRPLRDALTTIGDPRDQPMRRLLQTLRLTSVPDPRAAVDCDTPEALARANDMAAGERSADLPHETSPKER